MLTINVFYINNNKDLINIDLLIKYFFEKKSKFRNKKIKLVNKTQANLCTCTFNQKRNKTNIFVAFQELNLNAFEESVSTFLKSVVHKSIKEAESLSLEPIDETKGNEIYSKIVLKFNKYLLNKENLTPYFNFEYEEKTNKNLDIIDLVNEIFCEVLVSHLLINGNKRLATTLLVNFLYYFGFYLKYTKASLKNWSRHAEKIAQFVVYYENNDFESLCKETKKYILNNLVLALNFVEN